MADETEIRIKDLPRTATEADMVAGNFFVMDSSDTPRLPVELVAKASVQKNIRVSEAPDFDQNRTNKNAYKPGEFVNKDGVLYVFKNGHYGAWNEADVDIASVGDVLKNIDFFVKNRLSIGSQVVDENLYNTWEPGTITGGSEATSSYACRTRRFYDCSDVNGTQVTVKLVNSNFKFKVVVYSSAGVYENTSQYKSADYNLNDFGSNKKYRIVIAKADDSAFSTPITDSEANSSVYVEKADVTVGPTVAGKELIDAVEGQVESLSQHVDNDLTIMSSTDDVTLENSWTPGSISNGVDINSDYAYRTGFYDCSDVNGSQVTVKLTDSVNYGFKVVIYDSNGVYQTTTQRQFADLNMSSFGNQRKYRITLSHRDDTKFTTPITDSEANAIVYIEKNDVVIPPNVAGADELLGVVDQKIAEAIDVGSVEPFPITKMAFIGSSSTAMDVYTKRVVELFGLTNDDYELYGLSGYGAVDYVRENKMSWWGGCSDCQAVMLWISSNDFAEEQDLGDFDSTDTTDYTGALRAIFEWWSGSSFDGQLKLVLGPAQRWGYNSDPIPNPTMMNGKGITLKQYSDRLKEVAADYGIAFLDLYSESGINRYNAARTTRDGLHPTDAYYDRIGILAAKAMKQRCV